ncbi:polynucleotide kinase-phosphatase [Fictibacillus sp. 5RED26]|uniref:polynucleotide kinase-phosphatase n=1 Tax=Fictibacillus sp. 5RED26 TaxID=2745876 RepID=UPI0018CEC370|nr:polynucleotide kinase-phosphatase [Fictibacillus sp. 5RED26]MBH0157404.1 polynucleotide kinase-phosphatase [Fictibacillus sp. 5RED26]
MKIQLPCAGIVLLIGPSNSGKTTLMNNWIEQGLIIASEVVSSDQFRLLIGDTDFIEWGNRPKDEADVLMNTYQTLSQKAFQSMDSIIETRASLNKLTIIDATHLYSDDRLKYIELAKKNHVPSVAIVLDTPIDELMLRDERRDNPRGKKRIKQQVQVFSKNKRFIKKEGFHHEYFVKHNEIKELLLTRYTNPIEVDIDRGIDFIGDVHACYDELLELLNSLGYEPNGDDLFIHPEGRKFVSVGDVMSRGPKSIESMIFFKKHVDAGVAYMIDSNHGWKIARWLGGRSVTLSHGDEKVAEEFDQYASTHGIEKANILKTELKEFLLSAPSHYVFKKNGIRVAVAAHAGIKDEYIGKQSFTVSDFCRYGDTAHSDDNLKPVRKDWFTGHQSKELIIWGHDPKVQPLVINNTINIDQGVVFGGSLTAFRYPEKRFVSIKAKQDYSDMADNPLSAWKSMRLNPPNIARFIKGYSVLTEHFGQIKVKDGVVKSAIDSVSHFTVPIEELIYIPPTMSPTPEPSKLEDYLEHPAEAFDYYRTNGIETMVVQKKHMGSRGILLLFKDNEAAEKYLGRQTLGTINTRNGRPFFSKETQAEILKRLNKGLIQSGYFEKYDTDFVLLDAEILPWNLKANELISSQYAHVAEAAIMDRSKLKESLGSALEQGRDVESWILETDKRLSNALTFREVFQKYCWNTNGLDGIQIAPFHVLAHSHKTFFNMPHSWHMEMNKELSTISDLFIETEYKIVSDEASQKDAIRWWEEMTEEGHEGFVVKPEFFITKNVKGSILQPAIKVRGRKYLHIIYGMDYLLPENLKRLKQRNVTKKQKFALMEFALGMEGINRFVKEDSIERIHECVLATIALEADSIDPRL